MVIPEYFFHGKNFYLKVYRNIENIKIKKPVLTVGSFDGVHLGHLKVIDELKKLTEKHGGESVIFTFWPHPKKIVASDDYKIKLLTVIEEKIKIFEKYGIDNLIIAPFTKEFSEISSDDFITRILLQKINIKVLAIGYDHHFGKNREGGYDTLLKLSKKYNFIVDKIDALSIDNINISSTKIRNALLKGNVFTANRYLGYNYMLHGIVVEGDKLGRKLGFPTANINVNNQDKLIPANGVYAVKINIENETFNAMLNIGYRPTVNTNKNKVIEAIFLILTKLFIRKKFVLSL